MAQNESGKFNINVAVGKKYKKNLYHRDLTTAGFLQCIPMFYREVVPFASIHGNYQIWSRLNPLPVPTMGIVDYHYSKFFVRYKDLWPAWNDFYNRSVHYGSGVEWFPTESPFFTMHMLYQLLLSHNYLSDHSGDYEADFVYYFADNTTKSYDFTPDGFLIYKILTQLGYELSWCESDPKHYSLMPLYAFGKIYIDHYFPKRLYNNSLVAYVQNMLNFDAAGSMSMANNIVERGVNAIFVLTRQVFYDNHGYYEAWNNPSGPGSQSSAPTFTDEIGNTIDVTNETPVYNQDSVSGLTQVGLKTLAKISDMMKRYQLSGSRYIERFLARYGYKISDTHTSLKLGTDVINVQIGDVESNSDSNVSIGSQSYTSVVGDLAGKGVGAKNASIDFDNDSNYGILIGVFSIVPDSGLYQGVDVCNLHTHPEDYYTPEYDQLGSDAIPRAALLVSRNGVDNRDQIDSNNPFGFLPRYYELAISRNILSGAFRLPRLGSAELSAYHTYRDLSAMFRPETVAVGLEFLTARDSSQYNRIFYNSKYNEQFIVRFRAQYIDSSYKKSLSEVYEFENSGNKVVTVDGNSVTTN